MEHKRAMHLFFESPGNQPEVHVAHLEEDEKPQEILPDEAFAYQTFEVFYEDKEVDDPEIDGSTVRLTSAPLKMTKMLLPGGKTMTVEEVSRMEDGQKIAKMLREADVEKVVRTRHGGILPFDDSQHKTVEDRTDEMQADRDLDLETQKQFDGLT